MTFPAQKYLVMRASVSSAETIPYSSSPNLLLMRNYRPTTLKRNGQLPHWDEGVDGKLRGVTLMVKQHQMSPRSPHLGSIRNRLDTIPSDGESENDRPDRYRSVLCSTQF